MLYSVTQAWEYLNHGFCKERIREMFRNGEIPAQFIGNKYMTTKKHLDLFLMKFTNDIDMKQKAEYNRTHNIAAPPLSSLSMKDFNKLYRRN